MFPFEERVINENTVLREFKKTTITDEQMWHRDAENRTVVVLESGGWSFQLDDSLPVSLNEGDKIYIPKETWHRVIQGEGILKVKVIKETLVKEEDLDESEFSYLIAQAALDGKKSIKIGDKEYPVEMSKDKAKESVGEAKDKLKGNYYVGKKTRRTKSNKEMEREIKKCSKEPRPKSCYDEWTADKSYKKAKKESDSKIEEVLDEQLDSLLEEILITEKLSEKTRETLKKKAKEANMPLGALTGVYKKGLAAWLTGHRQGTPQHAWAMGRVNSFIRGGPARKVDKAEWKKVQKHRKK